MNKSIIKYFLFTIFSFMFIASNALADDSCSYKDQQALMKEAQNIKTSYEFIKDDPLNYHFIIYITNITDNLRLEITNDYLKKEVLNVYSADIKWGGGI